MTPPPDNSPTPTTPEAALPPATAVDDYAPSYAPQASHHHGFGGAPAAGHGLRTWLHALRRRWPLAVAIGLVCGSAAGAAAWFSHSPKYKAEALLTVSATEEQLLFSTADQANGSSFEIYKATQQQLMKGDFVLIGALRRVQVDRLPALKDEPDQVRWLSERLQVNFPGDAEIMSIGLTTGNEKEAKTLVQAVIDTYMAEVVDKEKERRRGKLKNLVDVHATAEAEYREKWEALSRRIKNLGTGDSESMALQQQLALQQFGDFRGELTRIQLQLRQQRAQLAAQQSSLEQLRQSGSQQLELSPDEVRLFMQADPAYAELEATVELLTSRQKMAQETLQPQASAKFVNRYRDQLMTLTNDIANRKQELQKRLQTNGQAEVEARIAQLQNEIAVSQEQERLFREDVDRYRAQFEQYGGSSIEVERMTWDIARLESFLNPIADEQQRLEVELQHAGDRISMRQPPVVHRMDTLTRRVQLTIFAALGAFGLPIAGLVWRDANAGRINSQEEVSQYTGLPVIGAVPLLPATALMATEAVPRRHRRRRDIFEESINGIVARLVAQNQDGRLRTIMISSATNGEGKTTLATQLAATLARTGCSTLLVDFDLRRPAIHRLFDLEQVPGVSEILRGESDTDEAIQETEVPNLSVVTAGRWHDHSLGLLTNGTTHQFMMELRESFDIVIVDGSPILPVADARLIGQFTDAMILSVIRDVSRTPQVLAAGEMLTAFGIRSLGAVVTGSTDNDHYYG